MSIDTIAISILTALPLLAQYHATGSVSFHNPEKEAILGKQLAADVRGRTTAMENPFVEEYVARLGQKLAAHVPYAGGHFIFGVIVEDLCLTVARTPRSAGRVRVRAGGSFPGGAGRD